jgi:hypothetical protein
MTSMSKEKNKKLDWTWIKKAEVHKWALSYLEGWSRRHPGGPSGKEIYDRLCLPGLRNGEDPMDRELHEKMKAAWASRKFRNKKGQLKHCSFALRTEVARQLEKLTRGRTKIETLERIISERAEQEIAYKSARKDEGVYRQRAKILEEHLDRALVELHTYKLILNEAGLDTSRQSGHRNEIESLTKERKSLILAELLALPSKIPNAKRKGSPRSARVTENATYSTRIPSLVNNTTPERLVTPNDAPKGARTKPQMDPQETDRSVDYHAPSDETTPPSLQAETAELGEAMTSQAEASPTALAITPDTQEPDEQTEAPTVPGNGSSAEAPIAAGSLEAERKASPVTAAPDALARAEEPHKHQKTDSASRTETKHVPASPAQEHDHPTDYAIYWGEPPNQLQMPTQHAGPTSIAFRAHYTQPETRYENVTNRQIDRQQMTSYSTSAAEAVKEPPACIEADEVAPTQETSDAACKSSYQLEQQATEATVAVSMPSNSAPNDTNRKRSVEEVRAALLRDNPPREKK